MLLSEVKDKKEYRGLSDDFVARVVAPYTAQYNIYSEKEKKKLLKEVRGQLRSLYGAFLVPGYDRRKKYLASMNAWNDIEKCERILSLHVSSKERLPFYPKIYKKLQGMVHYTTVLDLAGGMNVFSLPWMGHVHYYGIELNKDDVDFCNAYMEKFKLTGGVRWGDLLSFDTFVKTDVCFLFKILEGLEAVERGSTERLLKKLQSPYIVASFATRSLGGGKVISARRLKWFEQLVPVHEKFTLGTEVYYVFKREDVK